MLLLLIVDRVVQCSGDFVNFKRLRYAIYLSTEVLNCLPGTVSIAPETYMLICHWIRSRFCSIK